MAQLFSEFIATLGLLSVILAARRSQIAAIAIAVGAYISAAYWFAATSFANPAVTIARSLSDTFAGIRPADAPGFILAQLLGGIHCNGPCCMARTGWIRGTLTTGNSETPQALIESQPSKLLFL